MVAAQWRWAASEGRRIVQLLIATFRNPQRLDVPNLMALQLEAMTQFVMAMFSTK
jgi:hypothetical protein